MESTPAADRFVGIDVSKSWVDVHVRPDGTAFRCTTDGEGLAERHVAPHIFETRDEAQAFARSQRKGHV